MLDLDDEWFLGGMAADIYKRLRQEEEHVIRVDINPNFEPLRAYCAAWIIEKSKKIQTKKEPVFDLCPATVHLAVHILDRLITHKPDFAIAVVVLHIAAKMEEADNRIPKLEVLMDRVQGSKRNLKGMYLAVERQTLLLFDFKFLFPTVPQFVPYFISLAHEETYDVSFNFYDLNGRLFASDEDKVTCASCPQRHRIPASPEERKGLSQMMLNKYVDEHMELCLQDVWYRVHRPSLVAAACVAVARRRICWLRMDIWPARFQEICTIYAQEIVEIMTRLAADVRCIKGEQVFHSPCTEMDWKPLTPVEPSKSRPSYTKSNPTGLQSSASSDSGIDCDPHPPILTRQASFPASQSFAPTPMYHISQPAHPMYYGNGSQQPIYQQYHYPITNQYVPIVPRPQMPQLVHQNGVPQRIAGWSWVLINPNGAPPNQGVSIDGSRMSAGVDMAESARELDVNHNAKHQSNNICTYHKYVHMNQGVRKPFIIDPSPAPPDPSPPRMQTRSTRARKRQASSIPQPVPYKRPVYGLQYTDL